ncbi:hypothetical protein PR048_003241 [Dryococelus australis]|uniref:Uncharacterized protein n=1 Tax=Dryococelus australis TaxID=614101 RepID=A0ABQ9IML2_9NEOP|nr:hypothetical protein PR048_003241 [Dryococelus australis]
MDIVEKLLMNAPTTRSVLYYLKCRKRQEGDGSGQEIWNTEKRRCQLRKEKRYEIILPASQIQESLQQDRQYSQTVFELGAQSEQDVFTL